jgi:hypothetical protein
MTCGAPTSGHDGRDVQRLVEPVTRKRFTLCAGCRAVAERMQVRLVPESQIVRVRA